MAGHHWKHVWCLEEKKGYHTNIFLNRWKNLPESLCGYLWPSTYGIYDRLPIAIILWPYTYRRLHLAVYQWQPTYGHLPMVVYLWTSTYGRLPMDIYLRPSSYGRLLMQPTYGRLPIAIYLWPSSNGHLPMVVYLLPFTYDRLPMDVYLLPSAQMTWHRPNRWSEESRNAKKEKINLARRGVAIVTLLTTWRNTVT